MHIISIDNLLLVDDFHSFVVKLKPEPKKLILGCIGVVLFVGAGVIVAKKRKRDWFLKKTLCVANKNQNALHAKLQKLDEEDVSTVIQLYSNSKL